MQKMTALTCDGARVESEFYQHTSSPLLKLTRQYRPHLSNKKAQIQTESKKNLPKSIQTANLIMVSGDKRIMR